MRAHKDRDPHETVSLAREILAGLSVYPLETEWFDLSGRAYSVRLVDGHLSGLDGSGGQLASNGKGVTPALALASAYGEYLERMQVRSSWFLRAEFGLMSSPACFHPDEVTRPFAELLREQPEIMEQLVSLPLPATVARELDEEGVGCAPYYNVFEERTELLPLQLLDEVVAHNGACAGNSPEEALVQGLSEVAERFAIKRVFDSDDPRLPTIPDERLSSPGIADHLAALEQAGLAFSFKDCSEGRFPVLAIIVTDRERTRYSVCFGADPRFETAVERCFTEACQVTTVEALTRMRMGFDSPGQRGTAPRQVECLAAIRTGTACYPTGFFLNRGRSDLDAVFISEQTSSRDSLRFLLERYRRDGRKVYVRDVSFLGFPAFKTYVPGMSEIHVLNRDRPLLSRSETRRQRRCLARLKASSMEELRETALSIERSLGFPFFHERFSKALVDPGLLLADRSDFVTQFTSEPRGPHRFLALAFHRCGDLKRAADHFGIHLDGRIARGGVERPSAHEVCCHAYLRLRADGISHQDAGKSLVGLFDRQTVEAVLTDLAGGDGFRHLTLPDCGDCTACPVVEDCRFPRWQQLDQDLRARARAASIDQASLRQVFEGLSR